MPDELEEPHYPQNFGEWLDSIRRNPFMYFGRKSLSDLTVWRLGYSLARDDAKLKPSEEEAELGDEFDAFVSKKYRLPHESRNWQAKIVYMVWTDENAFDEFFRLLDEFREGKRKAREREAKRAAQAGKASGC